MNYEGIASGSFSGSHHSGSHYFRLNCSPNLHSKQGEMVGQPSSVLQQQEQQQISTGMNMQQQFSSSNDLKDPTSNIIVGSKLFVGQVPSMATEEQLHPVFEPYGTLLEIKIMRDRMGRSKGSAWVRYATDEMARNAIAALHEKHTVPPQTNPLRVQFAAPNAPKSHQHNRYFRNSMGMPNRYNYGGAVGGGNVQPNGMMARSGNNVGYMNPPTSTANASRYMPSSVGSNMDSVPMMTGPYTSSVNRFDNNGKNPKRDVSYSFADRSQGVPPMQYQQQRNFVSPFPTQQAYNTQQEVIHGNGSGSYDGVVGTNSAGTNMELNTGTAVDRDI